MVKKVFRCYRYLHSLSARTSVCLVRNQSTRFFFSRTISLPNSMRLKLISQNQGVRAGFRAIGNKPSEALQLEENFPPFYCVPWCGYYLKMWFCLALSNSKKLKARNSNVSKYYIKCKKPSVLIRLFSQFFEDFWRYFEKIFPFSTLREFSVKEQIFVPIKGGSIWF